MQKIAMIVENDSGDLYGYINSPDLDSKIDFQTSSARHVTSFSEAIAFCRGANADIYLRIADRWHWMRSVGKGTSASCGNDFIGKVCGSLKPFELL